MEQQKTYLEQCETNLRRHMIKFQKAERTYLEMLSKKEKIEANIKRVKKEGN